MMKIETIHTLDTEYSADSIEWCTHNKYCKFFACGTYQLTEDNSQKCSENEAVTKTQRKGRIYLFKFESTTEELLELQRLETAAILDMKWLPKNIDIPTLAAATALGEVLLYHLIDVKLQLVYSFQLDANNSNVLALSLDVASSEQNDSCSILVSDSTGAVHIWDYNAIVKDMPMAIKKHTWSAHNFEAWICSFDKWHEERRIYTGADDCLLHAYDLRTHDRIWTNKSHDAGVTSLLSHPQNEFQLVTGSYDENVRLFDTRAIKVPIFTLNLHGGIWRLKTQASKPNLLLAACMYENFSIVEMNGQGKDNLLELKGVYNEHESICYGADWCLDEADKSYLYMATCSFYDHKLCIARITEND